MEQYNVLLSIGKEQENAIKQPFSKNNWKYVNLLDTPSETKIRKRQRREIPSTHPDPQAHHDSPPEPSSPPPVEPAHHDNPPEPPSPPPVEQAQQNEEECPHCFLTPCVTLREHYWLGEGQPAHGDNHGVRIHKYKSYWKTINNLGGWLDPRYIQRKISAGGAEHDKRELMPNCVVNQLRQLYPKPPNLPYMGHMWI